MRYLFEGYELDIARRALRRGDDIVAITPQAFDLLHHLIRNRHRVVGKDELVAAIWGGRSISDSALTTRINAVRAALGDTGTRRLIKTFARKGLRFTAHVAEIGEPAVTAGDINIAQAPVPLSWRPAVAMGPLAQLSEEPAPEFFAESLADDVLAALSDVRWLRVIGLDATAAADPDVRYLLEGSVRRAGHRIRVGMRLVDAATRQHLWAARYERDLAGAFATQDEIAGAIALAVASVISKTEQRRASAKLPRDLGAWEAYQRGLWHMSRCDAAETRLAHAFFQRALELDPQHAAALGALAWSQMMAASIFSDMPIAEGCALSEPLIRQAIALDDEDPELRARQALAALLKGDLEEALQDAEHILAVTPNCAGALGVKGAALVYSGRREEGRRALHQYVRLSPRDPARPIRLSQIATSLYLDGNYEQAAVSARQVVRQYPAHPVAYRWLAASLGQLNRRDEAMDALRTLQAISPSSFEMYIRRRPKYCSVEYAPMLDGLRKAGWRD